MDTSPRPVVIIGAGVAGLCCARRLQQRQIPYVMLEASDDIGGRVRTDRLEGFLLDRGFQVLQTGYPEAQKELDYRALRLHPFHPGALVYYRGRLHRVADPFRQPQHLLATMLSPIGSMGDKIRIARLRYQVCRPPLAELFQQPETSTLTYLQAQGFSANIIERFFRPFYSGVFLEKELASSSRMFAFVFRMLAQGEAALPEGGIGAIAQQLAAPLLPGAYRCHCRVVALEEGQVRLEGGSVQAARAVVIATNAPQAAALLREERQVATTATTNMYFAAPAAPVKGPILVLDGENQGPVTNFLVPSQVSPSYAPAGQELVSATIVGLPEMTDQKLEKAVRRQLTGWFGPQVQTWRHLRTLRIADALPSQRPPTPNPYTPRVRVRPGVFLCGEYGSLSGLQWAMLSGRLAAEAVAADLAAAKM
ncbi:MAG: NAD(P)/FAD-dependent oxidoreductase [Desulfobacca sp.]|uniref:NAD(P)/FAD-dependent oxidoreductase n=1 Tax=Desulfobacca sp. TaxID=2067990 RepID=UPI00404B1667